MRIDATYFRGGSAEAKLVRRSGVGLHCGHTFEGLREIRR